MSEDAKSKAVSIVFRSCAGLGESLRDRFGSKDGGIRVGSGDLVEFVQTVSSAAAGIAQDIIEACEQEDK